MMIRGDARRTKGWKTPDAIHEDLHVLVPVYNPWRWKSRWKLVERSIQHFVDSGATVYVIEAAFGERDFATDEIAPNFIDNRSDISGTAPDCDHDAFTRGKHKWIHVRTSDELWLKENLINYGASLLPHDWKYVAWLDADISFVRPNWVGETIHKLQHYSFLQMFSHARDCGPDYELLDQDYPHADGPSFMKAYMDGSLDALANVGLPVSMRTKPRSDYYGGRVWPGLCWATRRDCWDKVGGLFDMAVWGGGDWHMAHALIGKRDSMMRKDLHRNYKAAVSAWADRCDRYIRKNVGCMTGTVLHHWHGPKPQRGYNTKHALLAQCGFDPTRHLKRDWQGLYQLNDDGSDDFVNLRDGFRRIALERNEDDNRI